MGKNRTLIAVSAAQPLTPLFKLYQVLNMARAGERIAMVKAGMPVAEAALNVEKNYYQLLIAPRRLAVAPANDGSSHAAQRLASSTVAPGELSASAEDHLPGLAVRGGYAYQPLLPAALSFIGVMGTYTLFDLGKRAPRLEQPNALVSAAELAIEASKAKVATDIKSSPFAMERGELAHRMVSAVGVQTTGCAAENTELFLTKAKLEVQMFQANLEYREALAGLKALMRER